MSARYTYKPGSDLLEETAFSTAGGLAMKRAYDAANRLASIQATNAAMYNGTNWLGGAALKAGSNNVPVAAWQGTNRSVAMPPAKPQVFLWDANGSASVVPDP